MAKSWNIPVTETLDTQLKEALEKSTFVSKAEFIRNAVRKELRSQ